MKIRESKDSPRVIREAKEDAPLRISGREGKRRDRVAMYHEKDNEFIKHGTYRTPGGAYYNRYYVRDEYGDGDELNCKGTVGPFTTEEEARQAMKDYKPNAVKESFVNKRARIKESRENPYERPDIFKTRKSAERERDTSSWYNGDEIVVRVEGGYTLMSPEDYRVWRNQR